MRKQVIYLSFTVLLLTAFSSFAWSHYNSACAAIKSKGVCCTKSTNSSETIFESMVKRFVGAVSVNN